MYESIMLAKNFESKRLCDQMNCRYNEDGICANEAYDAIFKEAHKLADQYDLIPTVCEISDIDEDICGSCGEPYVNSTENSEHFGRLVTETIRGNCDC
jgi:hypothetical protein